MKKIISLLLIIAMLTAALFSFASCAKEDPDTEDPDDSGQKSPEEDTAAIIQPEFKDYGRGTVDFSEMTYTRPDIPSAIEKLASVVEIIEKNEIEYASQLAKIKELDAPYTEIVSMSSLAEIHHNKNSADSYWSAENLYIDTAMPEFTQAIEALYVAAAASPHKESFANDYFGDELYEYENGGIYTDEVVALMAEEAKYENEYSSISTESFAFEFAISDEAPISLTYSEHLERIKVSYGTSSSAYENQRDRLAAEYEKAAAERSSEILVALLRIRRLIADELEYSSYREFAYDTIYHEYKPQDFEKFTSEVKNYVVPVYVTLSNYLFSPYISQYENGNNTSLQKSVLMNSLYELYASCEGEYKDIYSYMLQHSLYDIEPGATNRFQGAFTTYIEKYNAPYVFVSLTGTVSDYMTLSHEFGHFVDSYLNDGISSSLDLAEVSSQAMELLTLTKLTSALDEREARYLTYLKLDEIFSAIIFQSFYASVEDEMYKIPYDEITGEKLDAVVAKVAKDYGFSSSINSVEMILIPHIILYPFYVQSYATSAVVAAEIYSLERENAGAGFKAYGELIGGEAHGLSFEEALEEAGLTSPFENGALKNLSDEIYYLLLGAHFFNSSGDNVA